MDTTFFGGINRWAWDQTEKEFAIAPVVPLPDLESIREDADVYDLGALRGKRTLIGDIYGGIRAFPQDVP